MNSLRFLVQLSFAFLPLNIAYAEANDQHQSAQRAVMEKLDLIHHALKKSSGSFSRCEPPQVGACTFDNYCSAFAGRGADLYLYRDSEGHPIPNLTLIETMEASYACAGSKFSMVIEDPFLYPEQFVNAEAAGGEAVLRKNQDLYKKEVARTQRIFSEAKGRIIKILNGRRSKENSREIDNFISRVKAVSLSNSEKDFTGDDTDLFGGTICESANAFYAPSDHKITICPQMMNYPDAGLFSIIAHELGHSIDPCFSAIPISKEGNKFFMDNPMSLVDRDAKRKAYFAANAPQKNPFGSVISCLQSSTSINIKNPTKEEVNMMFADRRAVTEKHYGDLQYCGFFTGKGHVQESFADWISSEAVAHKISEIKDKGKSKEFAFQSLAFFLSFDCGNLKQTALAKVKTAVANTCPRLLEIEKKLNSDGVNTRSSHLDTSQRFSRILLVPSQIQKALECKPEETHQACR